MQYIAWIADNYRFGTGTFCVKNAVANIVIAAIVPPVTVTPGQNICDVNRLQFYTTFLGLKRATEAKISIKD